MRDGTARAADAWEALGIIEDTSALEISIRLHRSAMLLQRVQHDVVTQEGFSNWGEYETLAVLRRSERAITGRDLADASLITPTAVLGRLAGLESRGLIERRANSTDRRQRLVEILPAGVDLIDRTLLALESSRRRVLSGFTLQETESLSQLLYRLALALGDVSR